MKVWPRIKSLAWLLLVSLLLNAAIKLALGLPYIVKYVDVNSSLGYRMLQFLALDIINNTLASAVIPALFLLFNYRRSAYGLLLICILFVLKFMPAVVLGQLLLLLWVLAVVIRLSWIKLRDVYNYYRLK